MELSKTYDPASIEDKWYASWMKARIFHAEPDNRPSYTVAIPPPNVTGILHMGHVLNNTIQDILVRKKRMQGFNTCWVPGTDHASIATEAKVVALLAKQGIKKSDLSRDEFLEHAFAWKEKYGGIILQQLRKLGASCDWDRTAFTMEERYSEGVINVFCELYDKGLIYRGKRMVNWDPAAQTAISDEEVNHKDTNGFLYHLRYNISGTEDEYVTIATTRPETILGDTAIAINPEDERYIHLHGKTAIVPLVNREIPIILDSYVDKEFGTGCLKVTPAHDTNDYEIGLRHKLEFLDILNPDGTISEAGQLYVGEDRFKVRKQIATELEEKGHLVKQEPYTHSVGYSERTKAAIEPKLSMQWFLDMKDISKPALEAVLSEEVRLIPSKFINTYRYWMENVRDWCLSRQLWWGHQIPAYFLKGTDEVFVAPTAEKALQKAREKFPERDIQAEDLIQDPDVLDTWASSWLWPIGVFDGVMDPENKDFTYFYPTQDLVTAPEILFFWVARMIIAGYQFTGEKPFTNVYLTGIVRDHLRRKMSKSLGNSPDPLEMIEEYGADALRVGMMFSSPAGNDLLYKEELIKQGRNFANKIWNAFRLIKGLEAADTPAIERELAAIRWMENRVQEALQDINAQFEEFRISDALMSVYRLIWEDFCSWYLEMIKPDQGEQISRPAYDASIKLFERLMKILHPFMPFITEELWHGISERSKGDFISIASWPSVGTYDQQCLEDIALVKELITAIRGYRSQYQLSNREALPLHIGTADHPFQPYYPIIRKLANITSIAETAAKPEGTNSFNVRVFEFFIPAAEIDVEAEIEKIQKQIDRKERLLSGVKKKLGNDKFMNNAPANVIANEQKKLSDAESEIGILKTRLAQLDN
ncbi:MAG: valine--tRNA ligase [Bacteroidota bacterium]